MRPLSSRPQLALVGLVDATACVDHDVRRAAVAVAMGSGGNGRDERHGTARRLDR
jgi:hypothetical protein